MVQLFRIRRRHPLTLLAEITCPACRLRTKEPMPEDACVYFYECPTCRTLLRPAPGDCCVFCSYADRRCPPRTAANQ